MLKFILLVELICAVLIFNIQLRVIQLNIPILFSILFDYSLSQDVECSSLCYTAGLFLFNLLCVCIC